MHVAIAGWGARSAGLPLAALGVYFDGHMYLEIARSFPLPYSADGIAYTGFAPGYPALVALLHLVLPFAGWNALGLAASIIPAACAAVAFRLLARELGVTSLWPSLAFVVANFRWLQVSGTGHPEPLATCFALLCFLAHLRGRLGLSVLCLSFAGLTRFPAFLLGIPLAFDLLLRQRRHDVRTLAWLSVPPLAFALFVAYLHARIPGYVGIGEAHRMFWAAHPTWPFAGLVESFDRRLWGTLYPHFELTYAWVGVYVLSIAVGLRPAERERWFLALWVASIVLFHVSLAGFIGAADFARLVLLAWPAALLILWRAVGARLPAAAVAVLLAGLAVFDGWVSERSIWGGVLLQAQKHRFLAETIARTRSDTPRWVAFGEAGSQPGGRR